MTNGTTKFFTLVALLWLCAGAVLAQGTTRYVYDDNGRLRAVIAPNGEANVYEYDPAGNIRAIRRNAADQLEILDFFPREGPPGTLVTIIGTGFGAGISRVAFNGAASQTVTTNAPQVTAVVPTVATSGPLTVTTASGGTATSIVPFRVIGIGLLPTSATLLEQEPLQLTAFVATVSGDQRLTWSVNNIVGGNATVGTISATGLYVAPLLPTSVTTANFTIRATSTAEPELFSEVPVIVRGRNAFRTVLASGVSVSVPVTGAVTARAAAYSPGVSISIPVAGTSNLRASAYSPGVSISVPTGGAPSLLASAYSSGVSVNVPVAGAATRRVAAHSPGVSIAVSLPTITNVVPSSIARGATAAITITGTNFTGVNALRFLRTDGTVDDTITVSNLVVNATSLTATVSVNLNTTVGRRLVVVATPTLSSLPFNTTGLTLDIN